MRFLTTISVLLAATMLSGCGDKVPLADASSLAKAPVYTLGVGDELRVTVYGEDRLSGQFTVSSEGTISFPLLGSVQAEGMTVDQLRRAITAQLVSNGLVNNPVLSAQVTQTRPFFIRGEVGRPGRYPTGERMSLLQAITLAGDYTYRANRKYVYLRRAGTEGEIKLLASSDFAVQPGDIIRVGEDYF